MAKAITSLNLGDKVRFGRYKVENESMQDIIWQIASLNNHYRDANNSGIDDHITLITDKIIDLRGFDAKEPRNSNSDRQNSGNNRYRDSNLRQWLNKTGHPWYVATHTADDPPTDGGMSQPTGYDSKDGFLSSLNDMELAAILDTTLTVARNTVMDGGGSETVTDKIFLASNTEVGLANENNIVEGSLLPIFSNAASRITKLTQQAFTNTKSASKPSTVNDAWHWWLRTPNASSSRYVRGVDIAGTLHDLIHAFNGSLGVRPLCNLQSSILVSDEPDSDGIYEIIWTNVISDNLQKINNTDFSWTVETIGEHTNIKSQLHIFDESDNLIATGGIKNGIGTKSDTIIPTSAGNFKARVKLWSDVTAENWSNEISYTITVIPYILTLDKNINIQAGENLDKLKFNAKVNGKTLKLTSMDGEKIIYEGELLDTNKVDLEIEGKDGKIDNISYVIS